MSNVTVRVLDGWAVHDGKQQRTGGEQLEVTADTAAAWLAAGWVENVTKTRRRKPTS